MTIFHNENVPRASKVIFLHLLEFEQDWIMDQWEKNYYITAVAGSSNGSSLVVMSKGLYK